MLEGLEFRGEIGDLLLWAIQIHKMSAFLVLRKESS